MSKQGQREKLTEIQRNVCNWHRQHAMKAWNAGNWPLYQRHIRIADSITRKG